ncbi:YebC/PmpR family DNA-binding transcriptional regulator, partial [Patescibacteria group bacterium]|nr:YebC/PmpR family DNA-binding transcriptional regulator [Patescibacteria group bacterium]
HSKWSQIKRQKAVTDKKKGNLFTKLAKTITIATKQGGPDPDSNFKLRLAIDKARSSNMPNDNIERAIKRGSGETGENTIEEVIYEAFGPGGSAIIIEATTDNKNRTTAEIRNILSKHQGNLGNSGSVIWMFDAKGVLRILKNNLKNKEEFELNIIDAGAEDILEEEEGYSILTQPNDLPIIKKAVKQLNISIESSEIEMVPKNKIAAQEKEINQLNKLFEELEANDDINNYFTNANL